MVMPVYNEENTLGEIIGRVEGIPAVKEIVIVDDGSTDRSPEILAKIAGESTSGRPEIKVLTHASNQGKGAAVRTGISATTGDVVIIQDADLEYDPEDYERLLTPMRKGWAEVVYGSRFTGPHRNLLFWHWIGNRFLTLVCNILYDSTLSDMETGYKVFRGDLIRSLPIRSNRFDFEPEITARVLKRGIRIYEVPISYVGRERHEGKKITWKDGVVALWCLLRYRIRG